MVSRKDSIGSSSHSSISGSPTVSRQIEDVDKSVSLSSDESSSDDLLNDSEIAEDKILKRSIASLESVPKKKHLADVKSSLSLRQFDLGSHYDPRITESIEKITALNKQIQRSPTKVAVHSSSLNETQLKVRSLLKIPNVNNQYIDLIAKETISQKFIDWHFITENSTFDEHTFFYENQSVSNQERAANSSLEELMRSFGVSDATSKALFNDNKQLSNMKQYDTLCEISPVSVMMEKMIYYKKDSDVFLPYFICFILDRKVYESIECDIFWCTMTQKSFSESDFVNVYLSLVDSRDYFMHYRLVRLIPSIQSSLISHLFYPDGARVGENISANLILEFDELLDSESYEELLYFVLFIFGSKFVPYGNGKSVRYFLQCIDDVSHGSNNEVEIALLKGLLSLFIKM